MFRVNNKDTRTMSFHIEINHLICSTNQMAGFYVKQLPSDIFIGNPPFPSVSIPDFAQVNICRNYRNFRKSFQKFTHFFLTYFWPVFPFYTL